MLKKTIDTHDFAILLTVAQAKAQLRIEESFTDDDAQIEGFIEACQREVETHVGRALVQTTVLEFDGFCEEYAVAVLRDAECTKIEYLAADGDGVTYATLATDKYTFTRAFGQNGGYKLAFADDVPETYVSDAAVRAEFTVTCPSPILQAMLLKITDMYDFRNDRAVPNNTAADKILSAYRENW